MPIKMEKKMDRYAFEFVSILIISNFQRKIKEIMVRVFRFPLKPPDADYA